MLFENEEGREQPAPGPSREPRRIPAAFKTAKNPPTAVRTAPLDQPLHPSRRPKNAKTPHLSPASPGARLRLRRQHRILIWASPPLPRLSTPCPGWNPMMTAALSGASRRCLCFGCHPISHISGRSSRGLFEKISRPVRTASRRAPVSRREAAASSSEESNAPSACPVFVNNQGWRRACGQAPRFRTTLGLAPERYSFSRRRAPPAGPSPE